MPTLSCRIWGSTALNSRGATIENPLSRSAARLDRVFGSVSWSSLFPTAQVEHLPRKYSDHCPILIRIKQERQTLHPCGRRPFRFEAIWVKSAECERLIREAWRAGTGESSWIWFRMEY
ncbi:hypothetical protein Salat_1528100 [Sesamum alatum]|uniref:Uncharacterized protein n=1 Tax=Sesamum alatum TaxID=300844 RepID=A0AAE2CMF9_9LAMI|nr:hypothetical protein Salat_1528100 [Sesamum alatum]